MNCHWIEFEIASVKLLDRIVVPLLFRCNLDPFKCLSVIVFSWFINSNFFSCYNLFKLRFTCATLFRCLSFLTVMPEIATLHESDGNVEAFFLFIYLKLYLPLVRKIAFANKFQLYHKIKCIIY